MSVVNFDTLEFAKELEAHGFSAEQAQALVTSQKKAFSQSLETQLATKADIAKLDKEIVLVKWVVFAVFVIVAIPLVKSFFA